MLTGEAAIHGEARRNGRAISGTIKASGVQCLSDHVMYTMDEHWRCSAQLRSPRVTLSSLSPTRPIRTLCPYQTLLLPIVDSLRNEQSKQPPKRSFVRPDVDAKIMMFEKSGRRWKLLILDARPPSLAQVLYPYV